MYINITENIALDRTHKCARIDNKEVHLTGLEFGIIDYLCSRPNHICSREQIIDHVWGNKFQYDPGTLDVHLNALRHKLGFSKKRPIESVRGVGLVFHIEEKKAHYTINLQQLLQEWVDSHEVELSAKGLVPSIHLTPFVNELTIEPKALINMFDAILAAILPSAQPGSIKISSKLNIQHFTLALDINGTINELKIPIA